MTSKSRGKYKVLSGTCPDEKCQARLFFPSYDTSIECTHCGQRHERTALQDIQEVSNPGVALHNMIRNILVSNVAPKRGAEMVKVLGLSNYHCKLLSSLLTRYGMDKKTGKAKLLSEMNQGDMFDCCVLGDRAFLIDLEHVSVAGYGRDVSGSMHYLSETLEMIKVCNDGEERLMPIHADGDGHCLVHAVSRALVGRELFWHPLRCNLKKHFETNLQKYKELFKDFVDEREWKAIIAECDPDFIPPEGELLGLRNIHIFGLANVLKRPIILLDSLVCMQSLGDYSALFLPSLVEPEECRGKDGHLNKPLCIAWSSSGHNHYIPLVGIKKANLPLLPSIFIPKAWGVPQSLVSKYIEFNENGCCVIGGDRSLGDAYIQRLASSMEEVFTEEYGVHPTLVADVHHYVYHCTGVVGVQSQIVVQATKKAIQEERLYRCLTCDAICELHLMPEWFKRGGALYKLAVQNHGTLRGDKLYSFPMQGVVCKYNPEKDELVPESSNVGLEKCTWCQGTQMRLVRKDGAIVYKNGDRTKTPSKSTTCNCGYKHYWDGKEYDNLPQQLPVTLEWKNKVIRDTVPWFQHESDHTLNSNVYKVVSDVVQKHFPGVFGSERLVQRVVDQILEQTKAPENAEGKDGSIVSTSQSGAEDVSPQKMIISGHKTLHKEELGVSETERRIRQRLETFASLQQARHSSEPKEQELKDSSPRTSPSKYTEKDVCEVEQSSPSTSSHLAVPSTPSKVKFVRVVTSDGRQAQLHLEASGLTFQRLQNWIESEFQVPPSRQRIKYGFPPQELQVPPAGQESQLVALSHGDRVMVEIVLDPSESLLPSASVATSSRGKLTNLIPEASLPLESTEAEDELIKSLDALQKSTQDPLDNALLSLLLTANLSGQTVWQYAQKMSHLFSSGGLFYLQMQRDVGLLDEKHCRLPLIPDKVFRYNAQYDRLELCLEPHGHFPVSTGIEDRVLGKNKTEALESAGCKPVAGLSGMTSVSKKVQPAVPFQGTGYTLRGSATDVTGTERTTTAVHKRQENSVCEKSVSELDLPLLTRKGPGFSVLNPDRSNAINTTTDRLNDLASNLNVQSEINEQGTENILVTPCVKGSGDLGEQELSKEESDAMEIDGKIEGCHPQAMDTDDV